jgi:hypothetical protein
MSDNKALRDLDSVMSAVDTWRQKAFVVGVATMGEIPSGHKVVINIVSVDPDEPGCTYPTGGQIGRGQDAEKLVGLGKTILDRIALAAGLDWIPEMSGRIDDGSDPNRIVYQATTSHTDLTGAVHTVTQQYEMNFEARAKVLRTSKERQWEDKQQYADFRAKNPDKERFIDLAVRTDIEAMRVQGIGRAESGAKNRAVAAALGLRRGGYTASELRRKPFAVFRLVDDIDWQNDPVAHSAQIMRASGLAKALAYGGARQSLINTLLPPPKPQTLAIAAPTSGAMATIADPDEPLDEETETVIVSAPPADAKPVTPVDEPQPSTPAEPLTPAQFAELTQAAKVKALGDMLDARTWAQKPKKAITDLSEDTLCKWFAYGLTQPVKE